MEKTKNGWTVLDRDAGVLSLEYTFIKGATANTFAVRTGDGGMLVVSPSVRMPEAVFDDLLEFGEVSAVVASNGFHHLGLREWRTRFPQARFFADPLASKRIAKKNPDAPSLEPIAGVAELLGDDSSVGLTAAPATRCGETWAWAKTEGGTIWFTSDILANLAKLPSSLIPRLLFKVTGTKTGFGVFHAAMKVMVKDRKRVLRQLAGEMKTNPPSMIVPGHGLPLDGADIADRAQAIIAKAL